MRKLERWMFLQLNDETALDDDRSRKNKTKIALRNGVRICTYIIDDAWRWRWLIDGAEDIDLFLSFLMDCKYFL